MRVKKRRTRPRSPQVPPLLPTADKECPGWLWLAGHKAAEREGTTHSSNCFSLGIARRNRKSEQTGGQGLCAALKHWSVQTLTFTKPPGPLQPNPSSLHVPLMIFKQKCHPCGIYVPPPQSISSVAVLKVTSSCSVFRARETSAGFKRRRKGKNRAKPINQ